MIEFTKKNTLAIKGIAILLMYFHHNFLRMSRFEEYVIISAPFADETIVQIAKFCKICVSAFVFLTGYGMFLAYEKKGITKESIKEIVTKRYVSLMAGYIIIFAGTQIVAFFIDRGRQIDIYGGGAKGLSHFFLDFMGLSDLLGLQPFVVTWWYMGLAIMLILLSPLILTAYKKFGILTLFLSILLPRALGLEMTDLVRWMFTLLLGIWCADQKILSRMKGFQITKNVYISKVMKFVFGIFIIYACYYIRGRKFCNDFLDIADGVSIFFVIWFSFEFIINIKYLNKVLEFLGVHSMNMFLTHTVIRAYWMDEFIYSFHYVPLIMLVLVVITVALSVVIEWLKKISGYNLIWNKLIHKLQ